MRLAALELGPPPAAPPPATANNAVGGGVGGTFHGATLPQKVSRICTHLGLDARSSLSAAVAAANESTGVAAEGGLLQQVDRLIALGAAVCLFEAPHQAGVTVYGVWRVS